MKISKAITLAIALLATSGLHSQKNTPAGKWILKEHFVDVKDSIEDSRHQKNVFNNEFKSYMIFDSSGNYHQFFQDRIIEGKWKLQKKGKRLIVKYNNKGGTLSLRYYTQINFNQPLRLPETFPQLYDNKHDSFWGGHSKYVRSPERITDTSSLVGKWKIAYIQKGREKEAYNGKWTFEYRRDTSYIEGWYFESMNDSNNDHKTERFDPYSFSYVVDEANKDNLVLYGTRGNKFVFIYLKKIK